MNEVRVSIGRLVLDGFELDAADAGRAKRALAAELSTRLSGGGLPPGLAEGRATARLSRRPLQIAAWRDPTDLGAQVGQVLARGLGVGPAPGGRSG
jgi:hypothetical protein